jgi:hypothetical protein
LIDGRLFIDTKEIIHRLLQLPRVRHVLVVR